MVDLRIQTDHSGHIVVPEVAKVTLRRMTWIAVWQRLRLLMRPTECYKLLRYYPIKIPVLNTLKVLVLLRIKVIEVKEARLQALMYGIEAVEQRDLKAAGPIAGITEARVCRYISSCEQSVGLFWSFIQINYLK